MPPKKGDLKGVWCSVTEGLHKILLQNDVLIITSWHTHIAIMARPQTSWAILAHITSTYSPLLGTLTSNSDTQWLTLNLISMLLFLTR